MILRKIWKENCTGVQTEDIILQCRDNKNYFLCFFVNSGRILKDFLPSRDLCKLFTGREMFLTSALKSPKRQMQFLNLRQL